MYKLFYNRENLDFSVFPVFCYFQYVRLFSETLEALVWVVILTTLVCKCWNVSNTFLDLKNNFQIACTRVHFLRILHFFQTFQNIYFKEHLLMVASEIAQKYLNWENCNWRLEYSLFLFIYLGKKYISRT